MLANQLVMNEPVVNTLPLEESHTLRDNPRKTQCQVEGCRISLPKRRAYHKRYRICSYHATLSQIVLFGRCMRFCQQCGRFQLLSEFEGDKRSCRAKLDLHNARRKHAREAATRRAPGNKDNDDDGTGDSDSSAPPRKLSMGPHLASMNHLPGESLPSSGNISYYTGEEVTGAGGSRGAAAAAADNIIEDEEHSLDELLQDLEADDIVYHSNFPIAAKNNSHHSYYQPQGNEDLHITDDELLHQIFNAPILPLEHLPSTEAGFIGVGNVQGNSLLHYRHHNTTLAHNPPPPAHLTHAPLQQRPTLIQPLVQQQQRYNSYQIAEELLSVHNHTNPVVDFEAPYDLVRVSFKLFNVHPSELPATVSTELQRLMQTSSYLSENARIGCTHLTVEVLLSRRETKELESRGSAGLLQAALSRGHSFFPKHTFEGPNGKVVAQIGSEVTLKTSTRDPMTVRMLAGSSTALCVNRILPFAAVSGSAATFHLLGSNISGCQDMVVCRQGPNVPDLEVVGPVTNSLSANSPCEVIESVLPRPVEGLHLVEVQRGSLLSATAAPLLIIDDFEVVNELRQLEYDTAGVGDEHAVASFLKNVGVIIDSSSTTTRACANATSTTAEAQARISEVAQRVAATCIVRGWPALLRRTLPAMVAPGADPCIAIENFKSYSKQGLSMLHLAVLSRCVAVVHVLADWASEIGWTWVCEAAPASAGGLTPLHLACLIDDDGVLASVLTSLYLDGTKLWTTVVASDQARPIDFAVWANNTAILVWLKKEGVVDESAGGSGRDGGVSCGGGGGNGARKEMEIIEDDGSGVPTTSTTTCTSTSNTNAKSAGGGADLNDCKDESESEDKALGHRSLGRRSSRATRSELERIRAERKTSYLDSICEEIKLVEEELNALPRSMVEAQNEQDREGGGVLRNVWSKGAIVAVTAGAAALGAYLRTLHL